MYIKQISISSFRNIKKRIIEPSKGVNVICGDNAQGKTNFLEAIWICTGAKSFRNSKENDYIPFGDEKMKIHLDFFSEQRDKSIDIKISDKKEILVNGIKKIKTSEVAGVFCSVVFSPSHIDLINRGPAGRRNFLDTAICQIKPAYIDKTRRYGKIIQERNALLRNPNFSHNIYDMLELWDVQLAKLGAYIIKTRYEFINSIKPFQQKIYEGISSGKESMDISYKSCCDQASENEMEQTLLTKLKSKREDDLKYKTTSIGPHRDDLEILVDGIDAKNFASQGQQRSCVIALKLAEAQVFKEKTGEAPVILLDDVLSELDLKRQSFLVNKISDYQVFITCCDISSILSTENTQVFGCENGIVTAS